jgi:NTP pyrophosphatase (non-canonical NTP hydrolase)
MSKYKVEITEYLQRTVDVEAESEEDAVANVEEQYDKCNIVLDYSDFVKKEIEIYNPDKFTSKLELLQKRIDKFNKDRDWDQFHSPVNLSKSISIEAGELLECFQWSNDKYELEDVKEELADVMNYCLQMCNVLNLDPIDIINKKMDKTEKKYPVEKAKGKSTKYNKL